LVDPILTSSAIPFGGSALCGFAMGFALKKIIKWVLIGLGVLAGIIFIIIQWMSQNGYIHGPIAWDKLGNDTSAYIQHTATQLDLNNLGIVHSLGIPVTSGLGIGLVAGFLKG
jgi:uncharacterized membrane protein (Fun14 family)